MKPGMPLLLAILRGDPLPPADEQAWQQTLDLATAESVLPWLTHLVNTAPPAILEALQQARREAQINAFLYTAELTSLLKSFSQANLPVLLLKGPSLAERIYGSASLRPVRDLDLLVQPQHFAAAGQLLATLGFLPNSLPDDYHQSLTRNTVTVELHYEVENPLAFDFHLPSAWQNAVRTEFHGQPAHLFAPPDELLYLALHAVRHRYNRLSYVLDLTLALDHHGSQPQSRPQVTPLANLLILGTTMAAKLHPRVPHPREARVGELTTNANPQAPDSHLQASADQLWQQLLTEPETALTWQSLHRFYLDLEPTSTRRVARHLRHLRILTTRLTQPDRDFAAHYGLHRKWQAHLLRPLRLLLHRGAP